MKDIQEELIALKEEIRDLKTAQTIPSVLKTYTGEVIIPIGTYNGAYTWTVQFEDTLDTNTPLFYAPQYISVLPYRAGDNTLRIELYLLNTTYYSTERFTVYSSRPIHSINQNF